MAVPAATYTPGAGKERRRRRESSLVRLWHGELTFQGARRVLSRARLRRAAAV